MSAAHFDSSKPNLQTKAVLAANNSRKVHCTYIPGTRNKQAHCESARIACRSRAAGRRRPLEESCCCCCCCCTCALPLKAHFFFPRNAILEHICGNGVWMQRRGWRRRGVTFMAGEISCCEEKKKKGHRAALGCAFTSTSACICVRRAARGEVRRGPRGRQSDPDGFRRPRC